MTAQNDTTKTADKNAPATTDTDANDRGDVGQVTIRKSTRTITSVRTRTSTDPIHNAVKDAVKGEWYDIVVDDDGTKIDRVNRKLRAAAQKYDVGMNIHSDHPRAEDEQGKPIPGKVVVSFRTGDRDRRDKTVTAEGTTNTGTGEGDKPTTDKAAPANATKPTTPAAKPTTTK